MREAPEPDRVLATVLFTDIVGSTERTAELGDRRWRDLLESHNAAIRRQLQRFRSRELNTAGDGFLASLDGAARARSVAPGPQSTPSLGSGSRSAQAFIRASAKSSTESRPGPRCTSVHAWRGQAGAGEILVSRTVHDLVAGSGIEFEGPRAVALKGVRSEWQLFAVSGGGS